jgi:RNA polymerase sigma factor (sigma-70 family)
MTSFLVRCASSTKLVHSFEEIDYRSKWFMIDKPAANAEATDAELVSRALSGDRESFNQIVVRYQTLICSLAYNGLGNLGQSEDVAQETFITAWKRLGHLREPGKLRGWLCGIVRNLVLKSLDREGREPVQNAETLETVDESPATHVLPSEEAISKEEEAILWRSLQNIPSLYREPLILFYREHRSIETVAEELGLSVDAVKQRLSRGRGLLQQEVQAFVEKTLRRTAPNQRFSGAVLAALPAAPAATAGLGAASKGAAAAKSGLLGTWLAPLFGILSGITAHWLIARAAPTVQERRLKRAAFIGFWIFVLVWCIPGQLGMGALSRHFGWSDRAYFRAMAGFWWFYAMAVATFSILMFRRISAIRQENETSVGFTATTAKPLKTGKRVVVVGGVYIACFWWVIDLAWQAHDWTMAVVVAALMVGLAIWNLVQLRGLTGPAVTRGVASHLGLAWAVILVILNFRLQAWEASLHGIGLEEMHRLLPPWILALLTLALMVWVALLLVLTKSRSRVAGP